MAPEMISLSGSGAVLYDEKVDVWSFGMMLFELLTLDVPYRVNGVDRFALPKLVAGGVRPGKIVCFIIIVVTMIMLVIGIIATPHTEQHASP